MECGVKVFSTSANEGKEGRKEPADRGKGKKGGRKEGRERTLKPANKMFKFLTGDSRGPSKKAAGDN